MRLIPHLPHIRIADAAANAVGLALAGACGIFAGYMILRLQHMDNPPADLGLNFPAKSLKLEPQPVLVDPLHTNSTEPTQASTTDRWSPATAQPYRADAPVLGYRLLSVIDGIAFIEVTDAKGARLEPVSLGSDLRGAGTVTAIGRVNGRWQVTAGATRLATDQ